jgi:hypothetical protein
MLGAGPQGAVVHFRANVIGIVGAIAIAIALSGCANVEVENKDAWFSKPFQIASKKGGFTFSELQESKVRAQPITASDLIAANGSCPAPAAQQAAASAPVDPSGGAPPATDTSALLGGGIALGMSECDVVFRAGAPSDTQIDQTNHDRTTVLTFNSGPHPGIYHFRGGALMEIERGQITPPTQTAKKKPVTSPKTNKQAAKE